MSAAGESDPLAALASVLCVATKRGKPLILWSPPAADAANLRALNEADRDERLKLKVVGVGNVVKGQLVDRSRRVCTADVVGQQLC